jgi:hypothetical protein
MALSTSTFTAAGGAVSDIFAGIGDLQGGALKAKGLNLQASGLRIKAQGDLAEAGEYDLAGNLARKNVEFTEQSTAIKQMQQDRANTMAIGGQQADVASAGFAASGSALDLLRDSASQGALTKAVLGQQGLITEAGYQEQADSFAVMSSAARTAAAGEFGVADQTDQLAKDTQSASDTAAAGSFISGAIKGIGAIASIGLAPFTGGLSLAALPALGSLDASGNG